MAEYDHYQPIEADPWFHLWHKPIPQDWFFAFRQFLSIGGGAVVGGPNAVFVSPVLSDELLY